MNAVQEECPRIAALLSPFYDGELDLQCMGEVERHLSACAVCKARLESMAEVTTQLNAGLGSVTVAHEPMRDRVLLAACRAKEAASGLGWMQKLGIAAAGFLVYFGLAQVLLPTAPGSQDDAVFVAHTHRIIGADRPEMEHVVRSLETSIPFLFRSGMRSSSIPGAELTPFELTPEAQLTRLVAMQEIR